MLLRWKNVGMPPEIQGMAESMMRNPAFAQMAQGTVNLCLVVEMIPVWSTNKCALHLF